LKPDLILAVAQLDLGKAVGEKRMNRNMTSMGVACILLYAVTPASAQQNDPGAGGELFQKVQAEFAEAYNRKDVAAMAGFFDENGVRITPSGIFRGRDAIRSEMQSARQVGLGARCGSRSRTPLWTRGGLQLLVAALVRSGPLSPTPRHGRCYVGFRIDKSVIFKVT
jgi:hypothetical protein